MDTFELFQRLSVALAIGLMIGLERGWRERDEPEGGRVAGLRTHALSGLLGGVLGAISLRFGDGGAFAFGLAFAVFSAAMTVYFHREAVRDDKLNATPVVAQMLAFALGAFAVLGDMAAAAASGVAATALLALKTFLHAWVRRLTWPELRSALVLLAMTFILLPLLPNRTVDPWGAVNPYELWLMTIMIAAISFAGYAAIKLAGERSGILITGVAGGLASSTAVTMTMARLAKEHPEQGRLLTAGALASGATMMVRVMALLGVLNLQILALIGLPIGVAALGQLAAAGYFLRSSPTSEGTGRRIELDNPFDLMTVLKFGAFLTAIGVAAKAANAFLGSAGSYAVAAVSGLADVDAITLAMSRMGGEALGIDVASHAVLIAVAVNTLTKAVLAWVAGGSQTGKRMMGASLLALLAGLLAALL